MLEHDIDKGGRREWQNSKAWEALQTALRKAEIGSYKQAQALLAEHVKYKDETGVLR